jgi:hypothetical protein
LCDIEYEKDQRQWKVRTEKEHKPDHQRGHNCYPFRLSLSNI